MSMNLIQMPEGILLDDASYSTTFGRFIIQPLEKGYGVTIGNSFRRILLSSLPGSAICAIRIGSVLHEFSTIPGVVEDVSELILNLKEIRLKPITRKSTTIRLQAKGPYTVTAQDIQNSSADFEILNLTQYVCTLNENAALDIEFRVGYGKGYIPAEENKIPDQPIGVIPIDSIYSPIKNVKMLVENTRVGQSTDYDKLILEIRTDGSITPEDALTQAAKILQEHVQMFIDFDISRGADEGDAESDEAAATIRRILTTSIEDLELSVRARNCLQTANIKTVGELVSKSEGELLKFRNFGRKSLSELGVLVANFGLTFGMDVDRYLKGQR